MKGFGRLSDKHTAVVLVRDADVIASAIREALADASPEQRPGLERAAAVIAAATADSEGRLRADWVRARLSDAGFTGAVDSVAAVKALRQAVPGLSLLAAVELQRDAVTHAK
ncbi:hypothetical protein ACYF6T_12110 [Streptomyces sp. 7R007]